MRPELSPLFVSQIWRYPVKSMGGHRMEFAAIGSRGITYDRGWAVRDEKAMVIRGARFIPRLLMCSAAYLPDTDAGLVPHVAITLPGGAVVNSDDPAIHRRLSDELGRQVTLVPLKPDPEMLRPTAGQEDPATREASMRERLGLEPGEPLPDLSGIPPGLMKELIEFGAPRGTHFDAFSITILTTSSIRRLQSFVPDVDLDVRRFRPNILLHDDGANEGVLEHAWLGRTVRIGSATFDVVMDAPRCTVIAAEQDGGIKRDSRITRAIVREMKQCIAVYCDVAQAGEVRVGDSLSLQM